MSLIVHIISNLFKVLYLSVCGAFRALIACVYTSNKRPNLSSDICLVTGAGQGLGRQLALHLADCGTTLVLWDIDGEKVRQTQSKLSKKLNCVPTYIHIHTCTFNTWCILYRLRVWPRRCVKKVVMLTGT